METDITIGNHGSVILFRPETEAGEEWLHENVQAEDWQWLGGALAVEPRYADELAKGAMEDGLSVE